MAPPTTSPVLFNASPTAAPPLFSSSPAFSAPIATSFLTPCAVLQAVMARTDSRSRDLRTSITLREPRARRRNARPRPQRQPLPDSPDASDRPVPDDLRNCGSRSRHNARLVPDDRRSSQDTSSTPAHATQNRQRQRPCPAPRLRPG